MIIKNGLLIDPVKEMTYVADLKIADLLTKKISIQEPSLQQPAVLRLLSVWQIQNQS